MDHASNQEAIGEKLFFFRSFKENQRSCLIFAHGGHLHGDGTFQVPSSTTLKFYQKEHGKAVVTNPWRAITGTPSESQMETVKGGILIPNYSLGKGVGSHWEGDTITYKQLEERQRSQGGDRLAHWAPHIVTVRRRFRCLGRLITLADTIPAILKHEPSITTIYICACRGDHTSSRFKSFLARI